MSAVEIRCATEADKDFWFSLDRHLPVSGFAEKVRTRTGLVLFSGGEAAGILRWYYFWDSIPFCTLLYIHPDLQRRGLGRALMRFWEDEMLSRGHDLTMTSTQADEDAQHFYRKLGYMDCGSFVLPFPGYSQPAELILAKMLR